jgi:hypothetical protein
MKNAITIFVKEKKMTGFIKEVRDHAISNSFFHETCGWDYVVECWSDEEILEVTKNCRTAAGAIKKVGQVVGARDSYRKEIQAEAF